MKYLVALAVLAVLGFTGAAMAEPISFASDSAPVNLDIACWVYLYFENPEASFDLDVEAGQGGAEDVETFTVGFNCPSYLWGSLTPPPGAPGVWDWWFIVPGWKEAWTYGNGEIGGVPADVNVSGITIMDPAGFYPGGQLDLYITCLD